MSNDEKKEEKKEKSLDDQLAESIEKIKEQCKPGEVQGFHYLILKANGDSDGNTIGKPGSESLMIGLQFSALLALAMNVVARSQITIMLNSLKKSIDEQFAKESTVQ